MDSTRWKKILYDWVRFKKTTINFDASTSKLKLQIKKTNLLNEDEIEESSLEDIDVALFYQRFAAKIQETDSTLKETDLESFLSGKNLFSFCSDLIIFFICSVLPKFHEFERNTRELWTFLHDFASSLLFLCLQNFTILSKMLRRTWLQESTNCAAFLRIDEKETRKRWTRYKWGFTCCHPRSGSVSLIASIHLFKSLEAFRSQNTFKACDKRSTEGNQKVKNTIGEWTTRKNVRWSWVEGELGQEPDYAWVLLTISYQIVG